MNVIALSCICVLGLLLFGLGMAVSAQRFHSRTLDGHSDAPDDPLHKLICAHANTAEFAPFLAMLMLYLGLQQPAAGTVALMVAVTLCRGLLVIGLLGGSLARPNPLRFIGALGTYLLGGALCVVALIER